MNQSSEGQEIMVMKLYPAFLEACDKTPDYLTMVIDTKRNIWPH